jgi:hypothetical protein
MFASNLYLLLCPGQSLYLFTCLTCFTNCANISTWYVLHIRGIINRLLYCGSLHVTKIHLNPFTFISCMTTYNQFLLNIRVITFVRCSTTKQRKFSRDFRALINLRDFKFSQSAWTPLDDTMWFLRESIMGWTLNNTYTPLYREFMSVYTFQLDLAYNVHVIKKSKNDDVKASRYIIKIMIKCLIITSFVLTVISFLSHLGKWQIASFSFGRSL